MAQRLGMWAWVHPNTEVFVPETPFLSVPHDHIVLPLRGYAHTCAVLGPLTTEGRMCVGYCVVGIMDAHAHEVRDVVVDVPKPPRLPKVGKVRFRNLMWPW